MNAGVTSKANTTVLPDFREIVEEWKDMVYNTALGIVQDETEAEDVTQDVFLQVYESLDQFRRESRISTWIYKITIRKAIDASKKKQRQKRGGFLRRIFEKVPEEELAHFNHPGVVLDNKEHAAALFAAIQKLPEKQKVAFVLHKLEGLSYMQIAEVMAVSTMAVESLLVRAKNNLKQLLKYYYEQHLK